MAVHPPTTTLDEVRTLADRLRRRGGVLVVTSGCFDLFHYGHLHFLRQSRALGDALVVLVSVDEDIRALKGPSRPVIPGWQRAEIVGALAVVDEVLLHHGAVFYPILEALRPHVFTKGDEYRGHPYLDTLRPYVGEVALLVGDAETTTGIIARVRAG
jgi:D-beta-D-heptose 7-phosphate kinase / D-beta-D-heptose 1-phosphate adenosyltransferase